MGDAKAGRDRGGWRFQFAPKLEGFALASSSSVVTRNSAVAVPTGMS